jgi:hypothetical protein
MLSLFRKKNSQREIYSIFSKGFHGDDFLIDITNFVLSNSKNFIETGSSEGTTLSFVAKNHPKVNCYSCEADKKAYDHAKEQTRQFPNVDLRNEHSPDFIFELAKEKPHLLQETNCFWLDAHGYGFKWPLREEVYFILGNFSRCYIFIDDFKVPGNPQFGYDIYENQECSLEYISDILSKFDTRIYFPSYSKVTSEYHPLRGWILIEVGNAEAMKSYSSENVFQFSKSQMK